MDALRKCTQVEPLWAMCWSRQGICANAIGDFDRARGVFRRALAIAPDHLYAPGYLANTEVLDGRSASVPASTAVPPGSVNAGYRVMAVALAHHALRHEEESRRAFEEMVAQHSHSGAANPTPPSCGSSGPRSGWMGASGW